MAGLEFSHVVEKKLFELKRKLIEMCDEKRGEKKLSHIMDSIGKLEFFPSAGVPISVIYDIEPEFEKYRMLYVDKNYILYYFEKDVVYITEMYDEREDVAMKFFGIRTTSQETLDYWKE